jgi:hypothetical protein
MLQLFFLALNSVCRPVQKTEPKLHLATELLLLYFNLVSTRDIMNLANVNFGDGIEVIIHVVLP